MLISLKFQWFVWRCRQSLLYVVEESGFNLQRYLIIIPYNNGWIWLSCVTGSSTDVVSTFILPPLSLKETQESAWSHRLEDRNINSLLLHHFWTTEHSTTMDILLLVNDFHNYRHLPPHSRRCSSRQLLEILSNLSEFRHQFSELEHYIHSPTSLRFSSWSGDSISSS